MNAKNNYREVGDFFCFYIYLTANILYVCAYAHTNIQTLLLGMPYHHLLGNQSV